MALFIFRMMNTSLLLRTLSTIGLGVSKLGASSNEDIKRIVDMAIEHGVNVIDTIVSDDRTVVPIIQAIQGKRDKVLLQMHLCIQYPRHTYSVTRSLETVKKAFQEELRNGEPTMPTSD